MILPSHNARQLLNATMSALYRVAYEHDVDFSDVVSVLPSQPSASTAPAARTYPPIPVAVQAEEGSQAASSADLSPSPTVCAGAIPESRTPALAVRAQGRSDVDASSECLSTSLPGAEGVVDRAHHPQSAVDADLEEQENAIIAETGKSVGEQSPAAPAKRVAGRQDDVRRVHAEHRDWPADRIAEHLGVLPAYVRKTAERLGLVLPSKRAFEQAQFSAPGHPAKTKAESVPLSPPTSFTLKERVRARHRQHPQWTARMIANDLGANPDSVATVLAAVRREEAGQAVEVQPAPPPAATLPNQPAGSIETRLKADAAERKKRLGARP